MKKLLNIYYLSLLFSSLWAFTENPIQKNDTIIANSEEAYYDDKGINLVGQVIVEHAIGQVSAQNLTIHPSIDREKKNKLNFLKINRNIHITFKEAGGELYCQQAEIDYAQMSGIFLGNSDYPDVIYLKQKGEHQKARPSFELKSRQMTFQLTQDKTTSASNQMLVKRIEANEHVRFCYNSDYLFMADSAVYQCISNASSSHIAGLITLSSKEKNSICEVTNLNGDHLFANSIHINTIERQLWMSQPQGILYLQRLSRSNQTLEFSSDELTWDDQQQTLLLKGHVHIVLNHALHIRTTHELTLKQITVDGKKTLQFLKAPQDTTISYFDLRKENNHVIYCPGSLLIDNKQQKMTLQGSSPMKDGENKIQQVSLDEALREMHADQVHIHYAWNQQHLILKKIILEGNVCLMSHFDSHIHESKSNLHCALTDYLEYFPKEQEMILTGTNGQRVLVFDRINHIQMSAPALKIHYNFSTKKHTIQGLGDVRLTFIEKELEQLKCYFPLTKSPKEEAIDEIRKR